MDEKELDMVSLKFLGFGDPDNLLITGDAEYNQLCHHMHKTDQTVLIKELLDRYGKSKKAADFIKISHNSTEVFKKICHDYKNKGKAFLNAYKEINDKTSEMKPAREHLVNALAEASKPGTKHKLGDVLCFLKKWIDINVGKFCGEAQRALKDRLQLLQNYVNSMGNTVSANCDWSKIPKPTEKHPKSIQLLMAQALVNLDK